MSSIYKYPLVITGEQQIEIPGGWGAMAVQVQDGVLCLWALVNPKAPKYKATIYIFGTGHPIENAERLAHIGTAQMGAFVWHVFRKLVS